MESKTNAVCDICGRSYKVCRTCQGIQSFKPWRTIVDTLEHYRIFLVLSEYTNTHDKEKAKHDLGYCNLDELDTFTENTKKAISEILADDAVNNVDVKVSQDIPMEENETKFVGDEDKAKTIRRKPSTKIQYQNDVTDTKETLD